ncbi:hypothetical protein EJ02DRAFT_452577 [Clathrospora elynae]|uniref:Uncharacterized protein n=1 Tax=Clathrospora elynae TaxID=706981 RepID=A0A6A5SVG5_9PLEO|nr:hypothetical protein EJ02DRAFT_452577 [Clathrospora elynae]
MAFLVCRVSSHAPSSFFPVGLFICFPLASCFLRYQKPYFCGMLRKPGWFATLILKFLGVYGR